MKPREDDCQRSFLGRNLAPLLAVGVAGITLVCGQRATADDPPAQAQASEQLDGSERNADLWLSPTRGDPLQLNWVPAGGQCFVFVRAADLWRSDAGRRAMRALGPRFDAALARWQTTVGVQWNDIDRLLLTFIPRSDGPVSVVSTIWLLDPTSAAASSGQVVGDNVLVCGPRPLVQEVVQSAGEPVLLRRQMNTLRQTTDQNRHVTVLLTPSFLLRETGDLFRGDLAALKPPLEQLLTEDTQAAAISLHVPQNEFYVELRLLMTLERRRALRHQFFQQFRQSLAASQERLTSLGTIGPHWSRLAARLPKMLTVTLDHLRCAWEDEQAVINLSLPAPAAHNLLLAGELLLAEEDRVGGSTGVPSELSITDALRLRIDYSFSQLSFDDAFQGLIREVNAVTPQANLQVRIDGEQLKKAGVTRNQELANFAPGEKTVAQLLTLLAMRANPAQIRHPSEAAQAVIWTVERDPQRPERKVLLVTTRQAAAENNYPLPKYFRRK